MSHPPDVLKPLKLPAHNNSNSQYDILAEFKKI